MTATVELVTASLDRLPGYREALVRGWSPDNANGMAIVPQMIAAIDRDPAAFVALQEDREAGGPPVRLPDGSFVQRLPGMVRWIWDGAFCGTLGLRWQPGGVSLPAHVLGHLGFAVVPWKRRRGYATAAIAAALPLARSVGLPYVELTTDSDNLASQRTIERAGGALIERFLKPAAYGGAEALRYRIALNEAD